MILLDFDLSKLLEILRGGVAARPLQLTLQHSILFYLISSNFI